MKQLKLCLSSAALSESVTCGGWNPGPVYTPLFSKQCIREKPLKKMQKKKNANLLSPAAFVLSPIFSPVTPHADMVQDPQSHRRAMALLPAWSNFSHHDQRSKGSAGKPT